jgi:flagellar protein FliS
MFGMMRNPAQSYAKVGLAVETASPHKLILMLFDGAIAAINIAKFELEAGDIPKKGASISKAIDIVSNGLRASLDVEAGELGERLAALYDYMVQRLLFANLHNNIAALDEVAGLLDTCAMHGPRSHRENRLLRK